MSDRQIRALERIVQATDSQEASWDLDRALRRYGKAAEYYAQIFIKLFWERFNISALFLDHEHDERGHDWPDQRHVLHVHGYRH